MLAMGMFEFLCTCLGSTYVTREVNFQFYLLETEFKSINATIVLSLEIRFSFGSRGFVVIPNIFLYRERLELFRKIICLVFVNPNYKLCGMSLALFYFECSVKTKLD